MRPYVVLVTKIDQIWEGNPEIRAHLGGKFIVLLVLYWQVENQFGSSKYSSLTFSWLKQFKHLQGVQDAVGVSGTGAVDGDQGV